MRCISPPTEFLCRPRIKKTKAVETRLLQCLGWNACESVKRPGSEGSNRPVVVQVTTTKGSRPSQVTVDPGKGGSEIPPVRCTGEAYSTDLATAGSTNNTCTSRILLFTDGCPNYGDAVWSRPKPLDCPGRGRAVLI
jgi:hypothetical protein